MTGIELLAFLIMPAVVMAFGWEQRPGVRA